MRRYPEDASVAELETEVLLSKLGKWLIQQPEWLRILEAPRQDRRRAERMLAHYIGTIPRRTDEPTPRALRRAITRQLRRLDDLA